MEALLAQALPRMTHQHWVVLAAAQDGRTLITPHDFVAHYWAICRDELLAWGALSHAQNGHVTDMGRAMLAAHRAGAAT